MTVTAGDAHAWSEVYLAGKGWMSFDPTDPGKPITPLRTGATRSTLPDAASSVPPPSLPTSSASSGAGSAAARSWSRVVRCR